MNATDNLQAHLNNLADWYMEWCLTVNHNISIHVTFKKR